MRVLLVYPNCDREVMAWGDMGAIAEPLALEYVAAACEQAGHDAMILDLRLHPEQLELMLFAYQPDVVGVTGYSMHVIRNLEVLARVKQILPTCQTMVGGHHATLLPIDFQQPQVDFVVVGEGLHPLGAILAAVAEGRRSPSVPSVWTRCGDEFRWGGEAEGFDIDDIPFPKRSLTADDRHRYYIDWMRPIALLRTTVGCPFRCSFCALWKIMDGKYYRRELEPV
ncbi:MAG TPA: cobalamin-dependent protein, partial [Actinomycetota bacterium]